MNEADFSYDMVRRPEFCPYCGARGVAAVASRYQGSRRHIAGTRSCPACGKVYGLTPWINDRAAAALAKARAGTEPPDGR